MLSFLSFKTCWFQRWCWELGRVQRKTTFKKKKKSIFPSLSHSKHSVGTVWFHNPLSLLKKECQVQDKSWTGWSFILVTFQNNISEPKTDVMSARRQTRPHPCVDGQQDKHANSCWVATRVITDSKQWHTHTRQPPRAPPVPLHPRRTLWTWMRLSRGHGHAICVCVCLCMYMPMCVWVGGCEASTAGLLSKQKICHGVQKVGDL